MLISVTKYSYKSLFYVFISLAIVLMSYFDPSISIPAPGFAESLARFGANAALSASCAAAFCSALLWVAAAFDSKDVFANATAASFSAVAVAFAVGGSTLDANARNWGTLLGFAFLLLIPGSLISVRSRKVLDVGPRKNRDEGQPVIASRDFRQAPEPGNLDTRTGVSVVPVLVLAAIVALVALRPRRR